MASKFQQLKPPSQTETKYLRMNCDQKKGADQSNNEARRKCCQPPPILRICSSCRIRLLLCRLARTLPKKNTARESNYRVSLNKVTIAPLRCSKEILQVFHFTTVVAHFFYYCEHKKRVIEQRSVPCNQGRPHMCLDDLVLITFAIWSKTIETDVMCLLKYQIWRACLRHCSALWRMVLLLPANRNRSYTN